MGQRQEVQSIYALLPLGNDGYRFDPVGASPAVRKYG